LEAGVASGWTLLVPAFNLAPKFMPDFGTGGARHCAACHRTAQQNPAATNPVSNLVISIPSFTHYIVGASTDWRITSRIPGPPSHARRAQEGRRRPCEIVPFVMSDIVVKNLERSDFDRLVPLGERGRHGPRGARAHRTDAFVPVTDLPGSSIVGNWVTVSVAPGNTMIHVAVELRREGDVLTVDPTSPG
jgi:hypothetical protein